ncbi:MAG: hypothetical protein PHY48_03940 [Candidatus Cloacimonetes bacterium]|nr:hypothetical protein [Candidatus Cloacimonadota bacterium]
MKKVLFGLPNADLASGETEFTTPFNKTHGERFTLRGYLGYLAV